jgi:hypothetical protein
MSTRLTLVLLAGLCLAVPAEAQELLANEKLPAIKRLIGTKAKQNSLRCDVHAWQPLLDFSLRFVTGFGISARFEQFTVGEELVSFLRVTPEEGQAVLMAESFDIPPIPPGMTRQDPKRLEVEMSGGFVIGEGRYHVELLLFDQRGHSFHK